MPYYITPGYNQPEIYNKLLNANTEEEKYLIQKEIADLNRVALKKAKLERQNVIQAENLASKRGKLEGQNTLKTMKEVTGYAPMGGYNYLMLCPSLLRSIKSSSSNGISPKFN